MPGKVTEESRTLAALYEVGVRLRQALTLIEEKKHVGGDRSLGVLNALSLLRMAFDRLLTAKEVKAWRSRVASRLATADQQWLRRLPLEEYLDDAAAEVAGLVTDLVGIAEHFAGVLGKNTPGAEDWLRLGMAVAASGRDIGPEELGRLSEPALAAGAALDAISRSPEV